MERREYTNVEQSEFAYERLWASFERDKQGNPLITEIGEKSGEIETDQEFDDFLKSLRDEILD